MNAGEAPMAGGSHATILYVGEREAAEHAQALLADAGLTVAIATDGAAALRFLPTVPVELVLCESSLPDMEGSDLARAIKQAPATAPIPVILALKTDDSLARERALATGADDVVVKPLERGGVLAVISGRLKIRSLQRDVKDLEGVVVSLSRALDDRDAVTAGRAERVAHWATQIGSAIGLSQEQLISLYKAALLHDIGTVSVPQSILAKPGPLESAEYSQVMRHPAEGERLLQSIPQADRVLPAIRHHHERIDGSGYPDGLSGESIPLFARILAVADTFVALTSDRPYRSRRSPAEAIETLKRGAGQQWDATLVDRFVDVLKEVEGVPSEFQSTA